MRGALVFKTPFSLEFAVNKDDLNLWGSHTPMILKHNHRQGEGKEWANTLNRLRVGICTEEDELRLKSRETMDPFLVADALHMFHENKDVKSHNDTMLNKLDAELVVIQAVINVNKKTGRKLTKSDINKKKGTIGTTEFLEFLEVRVGVRCIFVFNVDIMDGLVNGQCGTVIGIEKERNGQVQYIVVKFDDESCGKRQRHEFRNKLSQKYLEQNGTPIFRHELEFNLATRGGWTSSSTATLNQFPLRLGYAQTGHKMQVNFQSILNTMPILNLFIFREKLWQQEPRPLFIGTKTWLTVWPIQCLEGA